MDLCISHFDTLGYWDIPHDWYTLVYSLVPDLCNLASKNMQAGIQQLYIENLDHMVTVHKGFL